MSNDRFQLEKYENENFNTFIEEMTENGYKPYHYVGRGAYAGPAVIVCKEEFKHALSSTSVKLNWDSMGLDIVLYPERV